ncbi:Multiple inositol polyphosphate phosphatase [Nesidiocoris tenuis]|uniref:Multiple inositol polyphosphate phosphatase n=1 Tax=Nesidiocoris tenuis TaxID=355587 RepID=A0ABN7B4A1_9HEMI|nr:Multiple inositol polyphosphate phosphatase [Nesidiocoris tenuis]
MAAAVSGSTMSMYLIREDQYCLTEDESPYVQFSTQTSYQVARNRKPVVPVPNCRAEAVWALIRHGTRYPEPDADPRLQQLTDTALAVIENHEKRRSTFIVS